MSLVEAELCKNRSTYDTNQYKLIYKRDKLSYWAGLTRQEINREEIKMKFEINSIFSNKYTVGKSEQQSTDEIEAHSNNNFSSTVTKTTTTCI